MPTIPTLLTADEVAALLGENRKTVIERARRNEMACYRYGRTVKFSPEHVAEYLGRHEALVGSPSAVGRKPSLSTRSVDNLKRSA